MYEEKRKKTLIVILSIAVAILSVVAVFLIRKYINDNKTNPFYLASDSETVTIYGKDGISITLPRGSRVDIKNATVVVDEQDYNQLVYEDNVYYVTQNILEEDRNNCVREKELYTLRSHVLTAEYDSYRINGYVFKNEKVEVSGYHELLDDGSVDYYYLNNTGYMPSKYLSSEFYETGLDGSKYDEVFFASGGDPTKVEYYEKEELNFLDNKMPDIVKGLYINAEAISAADEYIEIAEETEGINAFVVDIKDCYVDTQLAYDSTVSKIYTPSTSNIPNSYETYRENVKKLKDAGYYLIGRITALKMMLLLMIMKMKHYFIMMNYMNMDLLSGQVYILVRCGNIMLP